MCLRKLLIGVFWLPRFAQGAPASTPTKTGTNDDGAVKLPALIEASPKLPLEQTDLVIKLPKSQELGMVSWLVRDPKTGVTWVIQRGDKADPVIAVDKEGRFLRSFGKGLHSSACDPARPRGSLSISVSRSFAKSESTRASGMQLNARSQAAYHGYSHLSKAGSHYSSSRASVVVNALRIMPLFIGRCSKSSEAAPAGILWQACQLADNDPYSLTARSHFSDCRL